MRRRKEKEHVGQDPAGAAATGEQAGAGGGHRRLTPVDIQQKEFRGARWGRGYNEGDVDQFLDEVTEEVARLHAETKRLREDLEYRGTARLQTDPAVEADAMVRRARDEASRIIADAESRARSLAAQEEGWREPQPFDAGLAGGGSFRPGVTDTPEWKASLGRFLTREKEFLQSLASLIQHHAEGVKDDAQRTRDEWAAIGTSDVGQAPPGPSPEEQPVPSSAGWDDVAGMPDSGSEDAMFEPEAGPLIDLTGERAGSSSGPDLASQERRTIEESEASFEGFESASEEWAGEGEEAGSAGEEWAETASPSMVARSHEASDAERASEERSIRELFWGED
jgi:DivIVA domain-containing protein